MSRSLMGVKRVNKMQYSFYTEHRTLKILKCFVTLFKNNHKWFNSQEICQIRERLFVLVYYG